jgi:hypothetical protein
MVEGGTDTITNMYYDLKSTIPVVIIDVRKCTEIYIIIERYIKYIG